MKRRFKSTIKHPVNSLNSSAGIVTQPQDLNNDRFGAIKGKKVDSPGSSADPLPNVGRVALSKKYQTARTRSDTPKTSEYAFFKKFKKDIGHHNSDLLEKGSKLSKSSIAGTTSTYNMLKCPGKDLNSIQREMDYQTKECRSFSPVGDVIGLFKEAKFSSTAVTPVDSNAGISKEAKLKYFSLVTAATPADSNLRLSPLAAPSNNSGSQNPGNGIFAAKRHKLRQRANALFLDVEKLNSERFDLVSALLSRLLPGRKEDEDPQVRKGEINASTSSLAVSKPHLAETRPHSRRRGDTTEPEYRMSSSDGCPNNFFGRPEERVTLKLNNFTPAFHLIDYDAETGLHYEDAEYSQISDNKITKRLWDQSGSLPSSFFDLHERADDILHSENIPVSCEAQKLSLDWDFNEEKRYPELAITTIGVNKLCSPIATSRHIDYQWCTEKKLETLALYSPSLYTSSEHFDVLPYFRSRSLAQKFLPTNFCFKDIGTIFEDDEYAASGVDHFDLPLLCNSEDLTSLEGCNPENAFESGKSIVPYLSHPEKNHCDSDALLPMALDTFSWKFLSATNSPLQGGLSTYNPLSLPYREATIGLTGEEMENILCSLNPIETAPPFEQAFNSHTWSTCNTEVEVSYEEASGDLLLLDNSSWFTPVDEISSYHSDEWTWS